MQGGGAGGGGRGALAPHVLGIYLVNFGNFWKFIFRSLLSPPHKKFASAHPDGIVDMSFLYEFELVKDLALE